MPSRRPQRLPAPTSRPRCTSRGQSLVEFTLVIPILLVLVVGVADLGRVFAATISLEAAARDAAEAVSNEYLANPPGPMTAAPVPPGGYYANLHDVAARLVCAETRSQPGVDLDTATGRCPGMPYVAVCVHDGADNSCSGEANGSAIPASCAGMTTMPTNSQVDGQRRYVEVRLCYRFDSILRMPLFNFGTLWVERARVFDIPCYFSIGPATCG